MTQRNITVLMLGGAKRVSMAEQLVRAGKNLGINVNIVSHELDTQEPIASVGRIVVGSKYSDPAVDAELDAIVDDYNVKIVLPFVDSAIEVASRLRDRNSEVFVPVSDAELSHAMFDKVQAAELFAKHGVAIPATYTSENLHYPAIFKPRTGSASKGIIVAHNESECPAKELWDSYLIQEYVANNEEFTVDCYVGTQDGEVKCAVPRVRLATAGGEVIRTITRRIPSLEKEAHSVLTKLGFRGAVTLQFIHDLDSDRYLLMEVNPRLGGGVICSILAGADIASMIVEESEGFNALPKNKWVDGALMTRYFKEVMFVPEQTDNL